MSTVERLLRQQALPVVEVGRKVLVRRSAVKSWVAAQEIPIEHKLNSPALIGQQFEQFATCGEQTIEGIFSPH